MKEMLCYVQCSVWNQMKIWSSHLLDNLSNCLMNLKNSGDSTGFEPMTSAMPVQCSNQLSYEVTQWRAGQFVGLMFSRERNVIWHEFFRFMRQLLKLSSKCEGHIFIWYHMLCLKQATESNFLVDKGTFFQGLEGDNASTFSFSFIFRTNSVKMRVPCILWMMLVINW